MKKILAAVISGVMMVSLAGCSGSGGTTAATAAPAAASSEADTAETAAKTDTAEGSAEMGEVLHFKLAENQPEGNPITDGMYRFAELAKEYTGGTVNIEVYPNAALCDEASSIDQVMAGTLDFSRVNTNSLAPVVDLFGAFSMPYLFSDMEAKYRALDGDAGTMAFEELEEYQMVGLDYYEAGSRNFYTTDKPITSVSDLKGMKIRVQQTEVAISMVQALGAEATPMDYGEVFQGLQTGIVDGAENDFVSYYTSGHYEVAKNYTLDGHMAPPALVICSRKAWDQMTDSQKEGVRKASREAAEWQRQAMQDYQEESRAVCEESGCTIINVDVKEFQDAVSSVYDQYPQYQELVDLVRAAE
ncbi:MAG: TRAP transporter substrate-binding protein [Clostridiales bacterium]|nr:TRAP transporter substrate-binding protein [Clostridiales bacterium]